MGKDYVEERNGGLYLAGTRVSLDSVVYSFRNGETAEAIRSNFSDLTLEQVYGAITHYLSNQSAIDSYLATQQLLHEKARLEASPEDQELQAKIEAAVATSAGAR
ncbi:MAG: DUF433 domain-containing protein [Bryobacter sp.]|nr:DUF433 domain-containing protein [Bryobacter sp.]